MTNGEFERLTVQTDTLSMAVLPALGGKVASLRWLPRDLELLQGPLTPYGARTMTMGFEEGDASGFDECLPSVAACVVETPQGTVNVPDHGDFWRLPWEFEQAGPCLRMAATGVSLPLRLERTLKVEGDTLHIDYSVQNVGRHRADYAWSAHLMFSVDPCDRIVLPGSVRKVRVENSAGQRLGSRGAVHAWPRTWSGSGEALDLSPAGCPEDGIGDKLFVEASPECRAIIERRKHGVGVEVSFQRRQVPWLGLWLCYGGWPETGAQRQQCVGIEPCTAPADSLAEAINEGWARSLEPGESHPWELRIRVASVSLP